MRRRRQRAVTTAEPCKGAFYHHFRDTAAVLEAQLAEFEEEAVRRAIR
jgi:hypothetical protein